MQEAELCWSELSLPCIIRLYTCSSTQCVISSTGYGQMGGIYLSDCMRRKGRIVNVSISPGFQFMLWMSKTGLWMMLASNSRTGWHKTLCNFVKEESLALCSIMRHTSASLSPLVSIIFYHDYYLRGDPTDRTFVQLDVIITFDNILLIHPYVKYISTTEITVSTSAGAFLLWRLHVLSIQGEEVRQKIGCCSGFYAWRPPGPGVSHAAD